MSSVFAKHCGALEAHPEHTYHKKGLVLDCGGTTLSEPDPVNSPSHYTWGPVEVIEITERLGFCLGNVIKYVLRADHKGKPVEDLKKARWYLDREISRREWEVEK